MSGRRVDMLDIREILRRVRLGEHERAIARDLRVGRNTVKKYRRWAEEIGLLEEELPSTAELYALLQSSMPEAPPPPMESSVEPYRELVLRWRKRGFEAQTIWQRLVGDHGFEGSYDAVWRYIRKLEPDIPEATVRMEVEPGEEMQVDFGYAGLMWDPITARNRKTWAFVATLSLRLRSGQALEPPSVRRIRVRPGRGDVAAAAHARL